MNFWLGNTCSQAYVLVKVTANHTEQISQVNGFYYSSVYGKMPESGIIEIFPEICTLTI